MTVFKGYLLLARKNIGRILMYFGIFAFLAILVANSSESSVEKGFTANKMKIMLVDEDESDLSHIVCRYLKKIHKITVAENNKKELYEALYYQKCNLVIRIPKGMEEKAGMNQNMIELTQSPGSFDGIYVMQQISRLVARVLDYQKAGYTLEEGYQRMVRAPEARVSVMNMRGENAKYGEFFRCVPYLFMAGLGTGVATVIFYFRRRQVKDRMMASSISLSRQNAEAVLAVFLVGIFLYLLTLGLALLCYGLEFFALRTLPYFLLNIFIDMLLALSMAFLVGMLVKMEMVVTMCFTSVSLAFSFLGGVFVALDFFSPEMLQKAKFIPVYWYEVVNDLLMRYSSIDGTVKNQIWQAYGMQMLFVLAIFAVGLVIAKHQQQED